MKMQIDRYKYLVSKLLEVKSVGRYYQCKLGRFDGTDLYGGCFQKFKVEV